MALNQKPRGSVVRTPPDWFARYLFGAGAVNGPCVGNVVGVALYNNATDGTVLRVYGLNLFCNATNRLFFKTFAGSSGTPFTGKGAPGPIDPRTPVQPGLLYTQATAAGVGIPVGFYTVAANTIYDLAPGYPLAVVPSNYSFSVETENTNVQIIVAFRYLALYE